MATYKITYVKGDTYLTKKECYVDNVYDEYDAVEVGMYKYGLGDDCKILNVQFICE